MLKHTWLLLLFFWLDILTHKNPHILSIMTFIYSMVGQKYIKKGHRIVNKKEHRFNQQNVNIYHLCQANCAPHTYTMDAYFHFAFHQNVESLPFNWKPGWHFDGLINLPIRAVTHTEYHNENLHSLGPTTTTTTKNVMLKNVDKLQWMYV